MDEELYGALEKWAADELRSVNAQLGVGTMVIHAMFVATDAMTVARHSTDGERYSVAFAFSTSNQTFGL